MKKAIDQLDEIKKIIKKLAIKDYYIHCDGALSGVITPFHSPRPAFDFHEGIDSISISGHKFIGSPIPCSIVLCKNEHKDRIGSSISYVATKDTTITGSRNGLTPLILWYALKTMGINGIKKRVISSQNLAKYTITELRKIGLIAWKNPNAITVLLDTPSPWTCKKHQLAVEENITHIICMPSIKQEQIDDFVSDLKPDIDNSTGKDNTNDIHEAFLATHF